MNVQTISMDPRIANIHFKDYRKKVRQHREQRLEAARQKDNEGNRLRRAARSVMSLVEKEDTILMKSYRELAKGARIINVFDAILSAGLDKKTNSRLPLLAVAGADWKYAHLKHERSEIVFAKENWINWDYTRNKWKTPAVSFKQDNFPAELTNNQWREQAKLPKVGNCRAIVPSIPVHLRPAGDISEYHILWEATWEVHAPVDPFLIKHIAGNMYTVLAQWDLTPIERSVLEGRFS
jgi:hypothetical protein